MKRVVDFSGVPSWNIGSITANTYCGFTYGQERFIIIGTARGATGIALRHDKDRSNSYLNVFCSTKRELVEIIVKNGVRKQDVYVFDNNAEMVEWALNPSPLELVYSLN